MKLSPLFLALTAGVASAVPCHLSNVFGDHMVLQRAPAAPLLWGFANVGVSVKTTFAGVDYTSTADASGVWRQALPPQQASPLTGMGATINMTCSSGEQFGIADVLFGEVMLCGGQ